MHISNKLFLATGLITSVSFFCSALILINEKMSQIWEKNKSFENNENNEKNELLNSQRTVKAYELVVKTGLIGLISGVASASIVLYHLSEIKFGL